MLGFDFAALPPEINSGRMYLGPGAGSLLAAAGAWTSLADELAVAGSSYAAIVTELTSTAWFGPSSAVMAMSVAPYATWLNRTAGQAAETATQAQAAAAAYQLAFAMTVPPPVIAANRSLLLALIATNFFGQNSAAIASTEAQYALMWAQDATAMHIYTGSAAAAGALSPFTEPDHHGPPAQPTGPSTDSPLDQLESLAGSPGFEVVEHVPNVTNSVLSSANAVTSGRGIYITNMRLAAQSAGKPPSPPVTGRLVGAAPAPPDPMRVLAAVGRAHPVGRLSTPPAWVGAAPTARTIAAVAPNAPAAAAPPAFGGDPSGPDSAFNQSVLGTLSRDGPARPRQRSKPIIVRSPAAG